MPRARGLSLGLRDRILGRSPPALEAIFVAPRAGDPMQAVASARAQDSGLAGDRYAEGAGHWLGPDACAVTLIRAEDVDRIQRRSGLSLSSGEHRRNLVVRGLRMRQPVGSRLRIGDAVLVVVAPRPPCGYLERLTQRGMARALGRRSGFCLRVVQAGDMRTGDPVHWVEGPEANGSMEAPPASNAPQTP